MVSKMAQLLATPFPTFLMIIIIILSSEIPLSCFADVGAAGSYSTPYIPTECYGDDTTEFPSNNLFAAAGDGIWDNGAACGRQYMVRCISAPAPTSCIEPEATIQVKIVDYTNTAVSQPVLSSGTTMLFSDAAFRVLVSNDYGSPPDSSNSSPNSSSDVPATINIEFQQV